MSGTKVDATPAAENHTSASSAAPARAAPITVLQQLGNQGLQSLLRARLLQAKLSISHPHDSYEQEADRVAEQVMRMPVPPASAAVGAIQRLPERRELHRFSDTAADAPAVDAATEQSIQSLSGRGSPLPDAVRSFMEPRFGADFRAVRVHTDAHAHGLARSVNAQAFTVGRNVVFGAGHYSPDTEGGRRLLAHELTHVVQQSSAGARPPAGAVQRQVATAGSDRWSTMSAAGQKRAQNLFEQCWDLIARLFDAQRAHVSVLRGKWIKFLSENVLVRINDLDADSKIDGLANVLHDYSDTISRNVAKSYAAWEGLEQRYVDEHDWLARRNFEDAMLAAGWLEGQYNEAKRWLDAGAASYITDEDFSSLKLALDGGRDLSVGTLQASRNRAKRLEEVLDTVTELRVAGEDVDTYLPGWKRQVETELDNLAHLGARTRPTPGTDYPAEFARLRNALLAKQGAALRAHKREKTFSENTVLFVGGVAEGLAHPFIETARELLDLTQVGLYYASGGRYLPKLTSDLMQAFEHGATRTDVLKGIASGILGTPVRFTRAIMDGNWENVGREAVNYYYLVQLARHGPEYVKTKLPELLAFTQRGLRILRARVLGLQLGEARLLPRMPLPAEPTYLPPHRQVGGFLGPGKTVLPDPAPSPSVGGFGRRSEVPAPPRDEPVVQVEWPVETRVGGFGRSPQKNLAPVEPQTLVPPLKQIKGFRPPPPAPKSPNAIREIPRDGEIPDTGDFVIRLNPPH